MIYYGARSSLYYFHQLECCRRSSEPHDVFTVIGGMAWLHAVGLWTDRVYAIDIDPDAVTLCKKTVDALRGIDQLEDFKKWVTENASTKTTHLEGHGMEADHFYWHFGQYNFASQEHYTDLQRRLLRIPVFIVRDDLGEVNYASGRSVFVFVSNADGANGFNGDKILPRVLATARTKTTYVNWLHRITIEPNQHKTNYDDHRDL